MKSKKEKNDLKAALKELTIELTKNVDHLIAEDFGPLESNLTVVPEIDLLTDDIIGVLNLLGDIPGEL